MKKKKPNGMIKLPIAMPQNQLGKNNKKNACISLLTKQNGGLVPHKKTWKKLTSLNLIERTKQTIGRALNLLR